jgi:hypothetical protein
MRRPSLLRQDVVVTALAAALFLPLAPAVCGSAPTPGTAGSASADIDLTPQERAEVLKGKIVLRDLPNPGKNGRTFEAIGVLQGSLDEAFTVITDYRRYPEFMPSIEATAVREVSPTVAIVEIRLGLPLGMTKRYRLKYTAHKSAGGLDVTWEMVPWPEIPPGERIVDTSGGWTVRKFEAGGLLTAYRFYTDPGHVPLGLTGLAMALAKRSIPAVIEKTRNRIRTLFDLKRK